MKLTGKITLIKETETGTSKAGKAFSKVSFLVETDETYNNLYCFNMFQMDDNENEKKLIVNNFLKYNKVDTIVDVDFNIQTTEWKGKHFTSLSAWKVFKAEVVEEGSPEAEAADLAAANDDLPF